MKAKPDTNQELHIKPMLRSCRRMMYEIARGVNTPDNQSMLYAAKESVAALKKIYDVLKEIDRDETDSLQSSMSLN
ncbi:MAG: hypothetical protein FWE97_03375 [Dehalococcoidia bacterium]|nr:hypothetical protein [Dehalococcoidia bacterium]